MKSVKINKKKMIYLMVALTTFATLGTVLAYIMSQQIEQTTVVLNRSDMVTLSIETALPTSIFIEETASAEFLVTENIEISSFVFHINISSESDYLTTNGIIIGWTIYDNTHTQVIHEDPNTYPSLVTGSFIIVTSGFPSLDPAGLDFCYVKILIEVTSSYQHPGETMYLTVWAENS